MRGQAFSTFRILIGAVFAVALLSIVYYVVSSYNIPILGIETVRDVITQAKNAPDQCFLRNFVEFNAGDIVSAGSFSPFIVCLKSSYPPIQCSCSSCRIEQKVKISVSAKCSSVTGNCDVYFASEDCSV